MEPQIVVGSTKKAMVLTLARYALAAAGAYVTTKGIVTEDQFNNIVGGAMILIPTVWGVLAARKNNNDKKVMEPYVPNTIAVSK